MKKTFTEITVPLMALFCVSCGQFNGEQKVYIDNNFTGISSVETDGVFLDVNVSKNQGPDTYVYAQSMEPYKVYFEQKNGKLKVYMKRNGLNFKLNVRGSIDVKLGSDVKAMDIESVSGEVSVSGVELSDLDIESVSGDVSLEDTYALSYTCETVSGGSDAVNSTFASLSCEAVSGGIRLENVYSKRADLETVSGGIRLEKGDITKINGSGTSGGISLKNVVFEIFYGETVSGDITVHVPDALENYNRILNKRGKIDSYTSASASKNIKLETTSGSLAVSQI